MVAAHAQIESFQLALGQYKLDTGTFPTTEQGLQALRVKPRTSTQWHGPYLQKDLAARSLGPSVPLQVSRRSWRRAGHSFLRRRRPAGRGRNECRHRQLEVKQSQATQSGVTLIEMLIVVTIIAIIAGVSFPALTAGLASVRLSSASGSAASFLTSAMNRVDRREQAAAIVISPKENDARRLHRGIGRQAGSTTCRCRRESRSKATSRAGSCCMPGGTVPRMTLVLRNDKGARRSVQIDPTTGVPKVQRVEADSPSEARARQGFTLLEVLVATVIMGIAVAGLIAGLVAIGEECRAPDRL